MKSDMAGRQCYHCKQWVEKDEPHDCWTTTEAALTKDLSEDLQDAYARLRETAVEFGEQRIYASHSSIMFSRKACHFFIKPKRTFLEFYIFLGRAIKAPQIKKVVASSKVKRAHLIQIRHRDEVEAPLTEWMREAYELQDQLPTLKKAVAKKQRAISKAPKLEKKAAAARRPSKKAKKKR